MATCKLALEDGTVLTGRHFGAHGTRDGEVVFNTSMAGYQEILTDPSYCGQIVTMTYPLIGNYGVTDEDTESNGPRVEAFVVKELARRHSNFRASKPLADYLTENGIVGLEGVDTRAITRKLRIKGALKGVISSEILDDEALVQRAIDSPGLVGRDLVKQVSPKESFEWHHGFESPFAGPARGQQGGPNFHVVAIDCGIKRNILRNLVDCGCRVTVVPATATGEQIRSHSPDGLFVSNGPGDPEPVTYTIEVLKRLIADKIPTFGICLGMELLGLALGGRTFKLKFGHRGGNQPVQNLATGRVEITAQNHGFAVDIDSLDAGSVELTHVNLNDKTLEGIAHRELPIFAVQYHPEASPGPHDASYLFDCFVDMMKTRRPPTTEQMAEAQRRLEKRR
ncbi:MAG: glutamine-hydrolyzing carbamoyl-phosphate synthase small subunit [Phycisphaerae bacterium]|nr:glutamine-hydrolyzing carbamoyl-phosphate synthase small subunit [Phycisphaerae bacterium]